MLEATTNNYTTDVIQRGDAASGDFKEACGTANTQFSLAEKLNILARDGSIDLKSLDDGIVKLSGVKESIDGVGTKVQIYLNQFENYVQMYESGNISLEECKDLCVELWTRMLCDLEAMNIDDLRDGELGVAATNIIDINHLKDQRGHLFQDTMAKAFSIVIQETGIAMTAGETAILGASREAKMIERIATNTKNNIFELLNARSIKAMLFRLLFPKLKKQIEAEFEKQDTQITNALGTISLNIGGTALGLKLENKLIPLEAGQVIIGFQEKKHNGIIGPRSNGITAIRDGMQQIMGDGWENMTFENFIGKIGANTAKDIPAPVLAACKGKRLWDIATGKTTIFNTFIAKELLGGTTSDPLVGISKLIHVTGNPLKKIAEGIQSSDLDEKFIVELNLKNMDIPAIVVLLQIALGISDEDAMKKRNMGVPYAIVCNAHDVDKITKLAINNGLRAQVIGSVKERINTTEKNTISGVGVQESTMTF